MKQCLLSILITGFALTGSGVFAQSQGELERFNTSTMTEESNVVKLFPNPSVDYLQIEIKNSTLEDPRITLYNIIGNEITLEVEQKEEDVYEIQVKDLPPGYYLIAIKDEKSFFGETYKFVKR